MQNQPKLVCIPAGGPMPSGVLGGQKAGSSLPEPGSQECVVLTLPFCPFPELQEHKWSLLSSRAGRQDIWSPTCQTHDAPANPPSKDTHFIEEETEVRGMEPRHGWP